jgi:predicted Fe-Mo cluster-binding NifX family protein
MRIAIPIKEDKGMDSEVAEHFGRAGFFAIYDSKTRECEVTEMGEHEEKQCLPVKGLLKFQPDAIYVFGMGWRAANLLKSVGIEAKTGNYRTLREVVANLGSLENLESVCGHGGG